MPLGGFIGLSVEDLCLYVKNPEYCIDEMNARHFGVGLMQFRRWKEFMINPQCRGINRRGEQCRMMLYYHIPPVQSFNEDIDCYCSYHSRL